MGKLNSKFGESVMKMAAGAPLMSKGSFPNNPNQIDKESKPTQSNTFSPNNPDIKTKSSENNEDLMKSPLKLLQMAKNKGKERRVSSSIDNKAILKNNVDIDYQNKVDAHADKQVVEILMEKSTIKKKGNHKKGEKPKFEG